jgi:hypothetical protein
MKMIDTPIKTPKDLSTGGVSPDDFQPSFNGFSGAPPPVWLVKLLKWLFPIAALLFIALIAIPVAQCSARC